MSHWESNVFLNCSLSQLSPHPGSWYREMCGCIKFKSRDVTCIKAQVFNKDHWSGPALFVIVNAILNGLNNLDNI